MKLLCDHAKCRLPACQFLQTWAGGIICRCGEHLVPKVAERRDVEEIGPDEAQILAVQSS
jgi:hypothetical protein